MFEENGPRDESTDGFDRRSVLKTTAAALATAGSAGVGAAKSSPDITARMVDPDRPATAKRFLRRAFELGLDDRDVRHAFENLSAAQLDVVRDVYDDVTEWSLEVEDPVGVHSNIYTKSATLKKTPTGSDYTIIHQTDHTLEWDVDGGEVTEGDASSNGNAPPMLWHHKGIVNNWLGDHSEGVMSSRAHKYKHSVAGQHITTDVAVIDIVGHPDGSADVTKNIQ